MGTCVRGTDEPDDREGGGGGGSLTPCYIPTFQTGISYTVVDHVEHIPAQWTQLD